MENPVLKPLIKYMLGIIPNYTQINLRYQVLS